MIDRLSRSCVLWINVKVGVDLQHFCGTKHCLCSPPPIYLFFYFCYRMHIVHLIRLRDLIRVRTGFSFQCSIPGEKQADFALYCRSGRSRICHTSMTPNHLGKSGMQPSRSWPMRQGWRSLLESPTHSMIQRSECVFVHFAIWLVILHLHLFIWQTIFFYYYFFKFYFFSFYLKQLEIEALGLNSLIQAWGYK